MAKTPEVKSELFARDSEVRALHGAFCGVDEAGRGPLAGDVYAAAVVLPQGLLIPGLDDSKKLSPARRESLAIFIKENAAAWSVALATVEEIERLNILGAAMLAMKRAAEALPPGAARFALIDGNREPELSIPLETLVHGDALSASIAAASVLAKTARDAAMLELDKQYPQYGFARHKGYGTKEHYAAIERYGPCPAHRRTFLRKFYAQRQ